LFYCGTTSRNFVLVRRTTDRTCPTANVWRRTVLQIFEIRGK
jgi:hypothetical protein